MNCKHLENYNFDAQLFDNDWHKRVSKLQFAERRSLVYLLKKFVLKDYAMPKLGML